jgi:micrococcal nuclease
MGKSSFLRKIPGFRSGNKLKAIIASFFYGFLILSALTTFISTSPSLILGETTPSDQDGTILIKESPAELPIPDREDSPENNQTLPTPSPSPEKTPTPEVKQAAREKVKVTRIIDGDTIEIEGGKKIRYIGIDTPETVHPDKEVQCFGYEATNKNKELVENKEIEIEKDVSDTGRYGRLLRYVWMDSIFVNDYLVRQGYAYASSYPPDIKYQDQFSKAQQEATANNRGLWGQCVPKEEKEETTTIQATPTPYALPGQPENCVIKGNISHKNKEKIYHVPGCASYNQTVINEAKGERWFCSEEEAVAAGWRKALNCP